MGRRCRITFLYIPSRNVIIHRLYEIVNILLPAIISEGGVPSEVGKKKNSSENKKWGENFSQARSTRKGKVQPAGLFSRARVIIFHSFQAGKIRTLLCYVTLFPVLRILCQCWTRPTKNRKIPSVPSIDS